MKPIIEIKDISKKYRIGGDVLPYFTLREKITSIFNKNPKVSKNEFWALKDISFDVYPGESIGIIGKNGAGKTTLLKILSKITPPTKGRITMRGRVASLLEVGTGFHQELTGSENIYLNGSILGLTKQEINKKFDEIVDFSGVEKFLDTPIKRYSTGMQLRLAFAVAAHLNPEILIIDEVLAVGDASFQRKCINKMDEVGKSGRTIIFVSHNLSQVQSICNKGILLDEGIQLYNGNINETVSTYITEGKIEKNINLINLPRLGPNNPDFSFKSLEINKQKKITEGDFISLKIGFISRRTFNNLIVGFSITNSVNSNLIECRSTASINSLNIEKEGEFEMKVTFRSNLKEGIYNLNLGARSDEGLLEYIPSAGKIEIHNNNLYQETWSIPSNGLIITSSNWDIFPKD